MRTMKFCCAAAILVAAVCFAAAQDQTAPTVKHVPISPTSAASGKDMFKNYCASCHGTDAKGDGPAASALKTTPTDLTQLAKKEGGKYPSAHVASVIRGQATTVAHGTQEMPVWGPLFSSISQGHESEVQQRVANLVKYIETLQGK